MSQKLIPKPVQESVVEMTELVLPPDTNALGTIFGGKVMQWIDIAASIAASRHCRRIAVTASLDKLDFINSIRLGQIVILRASVNYAGRTSMEVGVKVQSENPLTGERRHTASAYLTFVALEEEGRPALVPPVLPETPEQKRRYKKGEERRKRRLAERES